MNYKLIKYGKNFYLTSDEKLDFSKNLYINTKGEAEKLIASTNTAFEVPLLDKSVIVKLIGEEEIDKLAIEYSENEYPTNLYTVEVGMPHRGTAFRGYKAGYNKAKETYKFTEEDLIQYSKSRLNVLLDMRQEWEDKSIPKEVFEKEVHKRLLASLSKEKNEWEVEIDEEIWKNSKVYDQPDSLLDNPVPKITNGYINILSIKQK